uniref:Uncharacterized protein n=1 Tax=Anguilla anguilla TaxID=7936 RepID=A0A0E9QD82_ANGAN
MSVILLVSARFSDMFGILRVVPVTFSGRSGPQ